MDFQLTEEQEMLKQVTRDFFSKELPKTLIEEMSEDPRGYSPDLWGRMAELGWMGLIVPEQYGGFGGDSMDLVVFMEEAGRACLQGPFSCTSVLSASTIVEAGNEQQKRQFLPSIARGDSIVTLALAEPGTTNSPDSLEVEARTVDGGYAVTGTKLFVPFAHIADFIICVARTGGGVSLFLVDGKAQGLGRELLPTISGDKQCEVTFNEVWVPQSDLLGEVDRGWVYLENVLSRAAVATCAQMLGGAQRVLEMTVEYAKERVQFGKPIGAQQAVQHHCANMAIDVDASRYITYQAAWMLSRGLPCRKELSMAKAWVNEAYQRVTSLGHQVHGAIAWQKDHSMHLFIKQAMLGKVSFGDTSYHEEIIAAEMGL